MFARFFEYRYDLFAMHLRKTLKEILDGVAPLQVIEQALYRNTRAGKDQFAAHNILIL